MRLFVRNASDGSIIEFDDLDAAVTPTAVSYLAPIVATVIPEPGMLGLAALAGLALLGRRRSLAG